MQVCCKMRNYVEELEKWHNVQENFYKQQSRDHWIRVGDDTNGHFFAVMKSRAASYHITTLVSDRGERHTKSADIKKQVLNFYKSFLGSAATTLPGVNLENLKKISNTKSLAATVSLH